MEQIGSMQFLDTLSKENSYIVIRVVEKHIGVGISQEHDGDMEVFLSPEQCQAVINWLQKANLIATLEG